MEREKTTQYFDVDKRVKKIKEIYHSKLKTSSKPKVFKSVIY